MVLKPNPDPVSSPTLSLDISPRSLPREVRVQVGARADAHPPPLPSWKGPGQLWLLAP